MLVDISKKGVNKYLIFDSTDANKELLKKYNDVWDGIKNKIKTINGGKENNHEKDYIKIKFNSDDNFKQTSKMSFNDYNYQICL